ncbi:MAG TPA: RNA polymerase sigma factor [Caulobacteraceae bacterium]|jgi:RNA polymerase sigma-70 factor (ECF subfamily)
MAAAQTALDYEAMDDPQLARRIAGGDRAAATLLIRRNNQRLFRAAWSVLKDRSEAEEVVQEGYMKAFAAIDRFEGASALSTWLTRIIVNEAISRLRSLQRRRRNMKNQGLALIEEHRQRHTETPSLAGAPEEAVMRRELSRLLEGAITRLPEPFRLVFVMHEIEGLSADDLSIALDAPVETIRTRLFRARRRLRADLGPELQRALGASFTFAGADCDALTARVLARFDAAQDDRTTDRT